VLGVPEAEVRMVMHDVGGNFGTRGAFNPEFGLVVWAARRVGRPVKWTCERSEAFLCDYQARDLAVTAELALDADGTFLAMRATFDPYSGPAQLIFAFEAVVIGGVGSLWGAILGAIAFLALEELLSLLTEQGNLILGPLLVLIALIGPTGLAGLLARSAGGGAR